MSLDDAVYKDCPSCPEIKKKIDRIDLALLGSDMQGGMVAKLQKLESFMRITVYISSAAIVAVVGLVVKALLGV